MRYTTGTLLGRGGMGEVYKAWDPVLERPVALKILHTRSPEAVERLLREARAQARLDHPNICRVYEVGADLDEPHIAMQFIDGDTLADAAPRMAREEIVAVIAQVAEAIHEAHRMGLIHRDLKPSNVLVEEVLMEEVLADEASVDERPVGDSPAAKNSRDLEQPETLSSAATTRWTPYVVDFGLVHEVEGTQLTAEGVVLGTAPYMAPEQAHGVPGMVDRRSDVYSLGATLYELLVGQPVFDGPAMDRVMQTLHREPIPPRRLQPQLPEDLETIVLRCLEKEPTQRYPSAKALAEDLRRFLADEPILARPPSLIYRARKVVRRNRTLAAVVVVATLALLALAATTLWTRWQAQERARQAQLFISEVKDVEWLMRATRMSPVHDVRSRESEMRQRLEALEARAAELDPEEGAIARYAVGRGYLALRADERAVEHLEAARAGGYRAPELAYALGLVYGRSYQQAMIQARGMGLPEAQVRAREEAQRRWRDPALALLNEGAEAASAVPAYVEGLVAYYEGETDAARDAAARALESAPWLYEAELLRGNAEMLEADGLWDNGDIDGALIHYRQAQDFADAALQRAPSDPEGYDLHCEVALHRMDMILYGRGGDLEALYPPLLESCARGLEVHPDDGELLITLSSMWLSFARGRAQLGTGDTEEAVAEAEALLEHMKVVAPDQRLLDNRLGQADSIRGRALVSSGGDPEPHWQRALEHFAQSLQSGGAPFNTHSQISTTAVRLARYQLRTGRDARETLATAVEHQQRAIEIAPDSSYNYNNLGRVHDIRARQAEMLGEDPRPILREAAEAYRRAVELNPANAYAWNNLGVSLMHRGAESGEREEDPAPDLDAAHQAFLTSLDHNPNYAAAYNNLGLAAIYRSRYQLRHGEVEAFETDLLAGLDEAEEHLRRAHQLQPSAFQPLTNLGRISTLRADALERRELSPSPALDAAEGWYRQALQRNPRDPETLVELAQVHLSQGRDDEARARAQEALAVDPTHEGARGVVERAGGK
ncbi:MAG: protein kinase [Acidobacteriota bacterium]